MLKEKIKNISYVGVLTCALFATMLVISINIFAMTISIVTEPAAEISGTVTRVSDDVVEIDDNQQLLIDYGKDLNCDLLQVGDEVKIVYGEKYLHTRNCEILK